MCSTENFKYFDFCSSYMNTQILQLISMQYSYQQVVTWHTSHYRLFVSNAHNHCLYIIQFNIKLICKL